MVSIRTVIPLLIAGVLSAQPAAAADYGCGRTPRNAKGQVAALVLQSAGAVTADRRAPRGAGARLKLVVCDKAGCGSPIEIGAPAAMAVGWQGDVLTLFSDAPYLRGRRSLGPDGQVALQPLGAAGPAALRYDFASCQQRPSAGA